MALAGFHCTYRMIKGEDERGQEIEKGKVGSGKVLEKEVPTKPRH